MCSTAGTGPVDSQAGRKVVQGGVRESGESKSEEDEDGLALHTTLCSSLKASSLMPALPLQPRPTLDLPPRLRPSPSFPLIAIISPFSLRLPPMRRPSRAWRPLRESFSTSLPGGGSWRAAECHSQPPPSMPPQPTLPPGFSAGAEPTTTLSFNSPALRQRPSRSAIPCG